MATPQEVIDGLVRRGLSPMLATAVAGNMQVESGLDTGINEVSPLVAGSRGGYGLNQWTGPRRRAFEDYVQSRGLNAADLDAQLDYTMLELQGPERNAYNALLAASSLEDATRIYSEKFLRPGIPHLDRRLAEANRLSGIQTGQTRQQPPQQQNALQPPQFQFNAGNLNVNDFLQPVNRLASVGYDQQTNPFLVRQQ